MSKGIHSLYKHHSAFFLGTHESDAGSLGSIIFLLAEVPAGVIAAVSMGNSGNSGLDV